MLLIVLLLWHNKLLRLAQQGLQTLTGELRTYNDRFDAALNNISGLCMVDAEQRLVVCNARYLDLFGIDAADTAIGFPLRNDFCVCYGVSLLVPSSRSSKH